MTVHRRYLRAADIAALTGASIRTVRRWIANEVIPSVKLGGARLVAEAEFERLILPQFASAKEGSCDDDK